MDLEDVIKLQNRIKELENIVTENDKEIERLYLLHKDLSND